MKYRVYFVTSLKARQAYIGKGPDGRIDQEHSKAFQRLTQQHDSEQWESAPFSSEEDSLIAEAVAIGIVKRVAKDIKLVNIQKSHKRRFAPRYPIPLVAGTVNKSALSRAIIVTVSPDMLQDGSGRVAPNCNWKPSTLAERARKYWHFKLSRVRSWESAKGAPKILVAVTKGSGRILAVFKIDNNKWFKDEENSQKRVAAIPIKINNANFKQMQGKEYTGNRKGGAVSYGRLVA